MSRTRWIGPLGLRSRDARRFDAALNAGAARLGPTWKWLVAGALLGALPFLASWSVGYAFWALPTAGGLASLLILGAAAGRPRTALAAVGLGMFVHCATAIALTANDPSSTASLLEDGPAYWAKTKHWVLTGESPEYELWWWLPAHVQLVAATVLLSYLSLGITTLYEGMYEVGLMNHYVGNLVREAHDPVTALFVGWHPWSVARGLGFLVLTFEVVDLSLSRLLGRSLSTRRERVIRWSIGLGFVALDGLLKLLWLEQIRLLIAGTLPPG